MNNIKVCVIGDIALDIRRAGTSTRTSPEDPSCKVLSDLTTTYELGMAGNVAAWLAAQDECQVTLCGLVTGDEEGRRIVELCGKQRILPCFPRIWEKDSRSKNRVTTVKERICHIEGNHIHQLVRCDCDMAYEINSEERSRIIEEVEKADLVVVADYGKGVFKGENGELLRDYLGGDCDSKTVVVNSKFPNQWQHYRIDTLICNEKEALEALVERGTNPLKTSNYIVTAGAKGVNSYCEHFGVERFPSLATKVVDVTGAGDSFAAGFSLHFHRHKIIDDAIEFGQWMAAQCVSKIGCGAPTRD